MADEDRESKYDIFRRLGWQEYEIYAMVLGDANTILQNTRAHLRWPEKAKNALRIEAKMFLDVLSRGEGNLYYADCLAELKKYEQTDSSGNLRKIRERVEAGYAALEKAVRSAA